MLQMQKNSRRGHLTREDRLSGLWALHIWSLLFFLLVPCGCEASQRAASVPASADTGQSTVNREELHMWMTVGEHRFAITLADSKAAREFASLLPLTLDMAELNGNEKHGDLSKALPANESRPGTIRNGDLLLWGSRTVVVFYKTFNSPYSYTRLGRIDNPQGLQKTLGNGDARVVFSTD